MMPRIFKMLAVLAALLAAGCAKAPPRYSFGEEGERTARAQALEAWVERQAERTATIKALVWLDLSDGEKERQTEAALLISRPSSIRVDAMDAIADVWAKAGSDGHTMWLYLPARDKLYSGRASLANLRRLMKFEWGVSEIIAAVAGLPPMEANAEILQVGAPKEHHFLIRGKNLHLWTDPRTGLPVKCARYRAEDSALDYTMSFSEWKRVGGVDFPHRVETTFPGRGARIVVVYRDAAFGGKVDPQLFAAPSRVKGKIVEFKE